MAPGITPGAIVAVRRDLPSRTFGKGGAATLPPSERLETSRTPSIGIYYLGVISMSKRLVALMAATCALLSSLIVGAAAAPVAAAPIPLLLTMEDGGGVLQIPRAGGPLPPREPDHLRRHPRHGPRRHRCDHGQQPHDPLVLVRGAGPGWGANYAEVDASFSEVSPGTYTGSVSPGGDMTLRTALRVDLHIEVPGTGITGDCTTSPVNLGLLSSAPYDEGTGRRDRGRRELLDPLVRRQPDLRGNHPHRPPERAPRRARPLPVPRPRRRSRAAAGAGRRVHHDVGGGTGGQRPLRRRGHPQRRRRP